MSTLEPSEVLQVEPLPLVSVVVCSMTSWAQMSDPLWSETPRLNALIVQGSCNVFMPLTTLVGLDRVPTSRQHPAKLSVLRPLPPAPPPGDPSPEGL